MTAQERPLRRLGRLLGSFGFAAVLLAFLFLLTWIGTLAQVEHGIYDIQKKYFESYFLVHWAGPFDFKIPFREMQPLFSVPAIPVPLPGGYLLLSLLLLNLTIGGLVRIRKERRTAGIIVAHVGIAILLVGGFIEFKWSEKGNLVISEQALLDRNPNMWPNQSDQFQSYHEWELILHEAVDEGIVREHLIVNAQWEDLGPGKQRAFASDALPFDVSVTRTFRNCRVVPKGPMSAGDGPVIDGYVVLAQPKDPEAERNVPGLYATFTEKASGKQTDAIVWGLQRQPFTLVAAGKSWIVDLKKKRFALPFSVRLDKFTFQRHPGTNSASVYLSDVTKIEGGREQSLKITMNEPLRHKGFTLYQSSFGPDGVQPGEPAYSVFSVVKNPSDQWPKWACYIIAVGLLWHFAGRLFRHVKSQNQRPVLPIEAPKPPSTKNLHVETARTHA